MTLVAAINASEIVSYPYHPSVLHDQLTDISLDQRRHLSCNAMIGAAAIPSLSKNKPAITSSLTKQDERASSAVTRLAGRPYLFARSIQ